RVAPGNAATSLLWLLLVQGTGAAGYDDLPGAGMPIGGRLGTGELDAVRQWIDAGAPETGGVPGTDALLRPCP
ncbi:MAG TPA: hypothetical protein VEM57_07350, partial [Candidatus Binatus sp.]|nr:hypothetical protein [Candidatus Binatus sp.]